MLPTLGTHKNPIRTKRVPKSIVVSQDWGSGNRPCQVVAIEIRTRDEEELAGHLLLHSFSSARPPYSSNCHPSRHDPGTQRY